MPLIVGVGLIVLIIIINIIFPYKLFVYSSLPKGLYGLVKVSDFVDKNPEIKELDLNPIFAYKDGAVAVDARVILEASS